MNSKQPNGDGVVGTGSSLILVGIDPDGLLCYK